MKTMLLIQTALLLLGTGLLWVFDAQYNAWSFLLGAAVSLANMSIFTVIWFQILQKKLVALAVFTIVFKYAFFGAVIYKILTIPGVSAIWFCVGLGTLIFAALTYPMLRLTLDTTK